MANKTILVILHELSPSGAPTLLLNQLKIIKDDASFIFLSAVEGELRTQFESIGKVYVLKYNVLNRSFGSKRLVLKFFSRIYIKCFTYYLLKKHKPIKILSNTITNSKLVYFFKNSQIPILTYVHEGPQLLIEAKKNGHVQRTLEYSSSILAVSNLVKNQLLEFNCTIPIYHVPGGVKVPKKIINDPCNSVQHRILIVGRMHFYKGSDLLIHFLKELIKLNKNVKIIWLGVDFSSIEYNILKFDLDKLGLSDYIDLQSLRNSNIDSFYKESDIVVSLSRSESFSLVALEAASFGKICLNFESIGGPDEIFAGLELPKISYLDLATMASETLKLLSNKELKLELENSVYTRLVIDYSIENSAENLKKILLKSISCHE